MTINKNFGQVSVSITNVKVNNQTVSSVQLGTASSAIINFRVTVTKPNDLTLGDCTIVIGTVDSSGSFSNQFPVETIYYGPNNTGSTATREFTLYNTDIDFNDNCYLVAKLNQTISPFLARISNQIPLKKLPTYTLSQTTTSVGCPSTTPITFTITSNAPPYTNQYIWSFGGGWVNSGNVNTSTITLTPTNNLLGNVIVTPTFNGIEQYPITSTVSRAPFSSTAAISGPTGICSGSGSYTISNIIAGQTVSWSLSNPSIGTLFNLSNAGASASFSGNGAQTLNAVITNQCGQTTTKTFVINTGATSFTSAASISGSGSFCSGSNVYTLSGVLAGQTVVWGLSDLTIANLSGSTSTQTTVNFTGSGALTLSATLTNSCGQTNTKTFQIYGGVPTFSSFTCGSGAQFCSGTVCVCETCLPGFELDAFVTANMNGQTTAEAGLASNWQWQKINNNIQITTNSGRKTYIAPNLLGATGVQVRARNSCGWSPWYTLNFDVVSCARAANATSNVYTVAPNPAKNIVNIEIRDKQHSNLKETTVSGELFDLKGISKSIIEIKNNKATFSVIGLNKGIYILKIYLDSKVESHQIIVE